MSQVLGSSAAASQRTSSDGGCPALSSQCQSACAFLPSSRRQRPFQATNPSAAPSTSLAVSKAVWRKRETGSATATQISPTKIWSVTYASSGKAWHT